MASEEERSTAGSWSFQNLLLQGQNGRGSPLVSTLGASAICLSPGGPLRPLTAAPHREDPSVHSPSGRDFGGGASHPLTSQLLPLTPGDTGLSPPTLKAPSQHQFSTAKRHLPWGYMACKEGETRATLTHCVGSSLERALAQCGPSRSQPCPGQLGHITAHGPQGRSGPHSQ